MIPGPDEVIACPHCEGLARKRTLLSGNTFGAQIWSDGKQVAPMLPRSPSVVRCSHCAGVYWLADARVVGEIDRDPLRSTWRGEEQREVDPEWERAIPISEPDEEEYHQALREGLARDRRQERLLRILTWWRRNDAFRQAPAGPSPPPIAGDARQNLERLISLLDEDADGTRIMKADALRQLGRFDEAAALLATVTEATLQDVVSRIADLCSAGDTCVRTVR